VRVLALPRRRVLLCAPALAVGGSSLATVLAGCARRQETPLAHLYGQAWVVGAYEEYAGAYHTMQASAEKLSFEAYAVLAQKGIAALDLLQRRDVPFFVQADEAGRAFGIVREVPERLTFTADMREEDRARATRQWEKARKHIHEDYAEIRRLNWALDRLLAQLQRIRGAVERTREEQFRLARQLEEIAEGDELPFALPYQVGRADYERIVLLLVERLEDDRVRLERVESAIVAVGLTVRSTDARSHSLADNLRKVLSAVVADAEASEPRPAVYPDEEARARAVEAARKLVEAIRKSPEYEAWASRERDAALAELGSLLLVLDAATGLPTSKVYRTVLDVFRGQGDYLAYLETAAGLVPSGELGSALQDGIALTRKVREAHDKGGALLAAAKRGGKPGKAVEAALGGLVNTGTEQARAEVHKQLVFFASERERAQAAEKLAETALGRMPV
jgi:hypothetical protein